MTAASPAMACRLYLITPPRIDDLEAFAATLAAALDAGPVAALQLRLKSAGEGDLERVAERLRGVAAARETALILNDRADLAARWDLDGAHVGQSDTSAVEARALLGPQRILGVTCHASRHLAMEAAEAGADYVAFGAFFPTATKETSARPEAEILAIWRETTDLPCVAIGGITAANCAPLVVAGADYLAVSAGVWNHPDGPAAAVRAFAEAIAAARD